MSVQFLEGFASTPHVGWPTVLKKPKDFHKREMNVDVKQKLSENLQNLPSEKLDNIVHIIKKRNSTLSQNDDEIEVDIDSVDIETLWELDRFVTNYKKSLSKNKRKAETPVLPRMETYQNAIQEKTFNLIVVEVPKENMTVVDEKEVASSSPKSDEQLNNASRSTSSSSSSSGSGSSSGDSKTDSSSAGSDAGNAGQ